MLHTGERNWAFQTKTILNDLGLTHLRINQERIIINLTIIQQRISVQYFNHGQTTKIIHKGFYPIPLQTLV